MRSAFPRGHAARRTGAVVLYLRAERGAAARAVLAARLHAITRFLRSALTNQSGNELPASTDSLQRELCSKTVYK